MAHLLIHRGLAKKYFTEKSISAFRYCFKKNYGIETDIHFTKDREIVFFHDFNLKGKFKINKYIKNVKYIINYINKKQKFSFYIKKINSFYEKAYLKLNINKSKKILNWKQMW